MELDRHDYSDQSSFIPLQGTLDGARSAGLSVGDYIDTVMSKTPGATQQAVDAMKRLGVFSEPISTVIEIGPGSGRYLEKTIAECHPARYEIYETAKPWAEYLVKTYGVLLQPTDARSLSASATGSADLVQAHKVFCSINFLPTCMYWQEIVRVTKSGGFAVFDLLTDACLKPAMIDRWAATKMNAGSYPTAMPRQTAIDYFVEHGFHLSGTITMPLGPAQTELFVFRKS